MKSAKVAKTVRLGALRLDIRQYSDGRFGFDYMPPGEERKKVRLESVIQAEDRAKEILGLAHGGRIDRTAITDDDYMEFLQHRALKGNGAVVPALVAEFSKIKLSKGLSPHTTRILLADLRAFAECFTGKIEDIPRKDAEKWLSARKVGDRRWNNIRENLVALWRFARREGAIKAAACGAELIERKKVKYNVETYSSEEFDAYLSTIARAWFPSLVTAGLCGVRPMEMWIEARSADPKPVLEWRHFNWEKRKIDVPPEVAKDRRRRFVPICDSAFELLTPWRSAKGFLAPREDVYKLTPVWAKAAGVKWRKDGWRHSYASYRLAITQNASALSEEMGNSVHMIRTHYLDLKHEDEGERWFASRLESLPRNVIRIA